MKDINQLLNLITEQENQLRSTQFIAPCLRGGRVKTKVAGMVYTFTIKQGKFEGWGIFQAVDETKATLVEEASFSQIAEYLEQFSSLRLRLAYCLSGKTWLAHTVNEHDAKQRLGQVKPMLVHLVTEGLPFEQIVTRWDGASCWFEELDRRADPWVIDEFKLALKQFISADDLQFKGITPEMRTVYDLVTKKTDGFSQHDQDNRKLQKALKIGGGELQNFQDRGQYWMVEWKTANGQRHTSAIAKSDLTVISSGICLSGRDRDFDLQSLVGVIEQR